MHGETGRRSVAVALLTVSDTRRPETDRSGATARRLLEAHGHRVVDSAIVPDEPESIVERVLAWLERADCEAVIVNGGTGVSRRDHTVEALAGLFDVRLDGFGELFRTLSYQEIGAAAMLSRAMGGIASRKPLFALPGSPAAVALGVERLILPALEHLVGELER